MTWLTLTYRDWSLHQLLRQLMAKFVSTLKIPHPEMHPFADINTLFSLLYSLLVASLPGLLQYMRYFTPNSLQ